jgi:hypothetical protein
MAVAQNSSGPVGPASSRSVDQHIDRQDALWPRRVLQPVTLLGLLYLYILYVLRPELLLHSQSPAFFARWPAFVETLRLWPGGLVEYLAAGLSQTFAQPWLGALVLTLSVALVTLFTRILFDTQKQSHTAPLRANLSFLPAILLLILLNRYMLPLSVILALAVALALSCVYARLPWRTPASRIATAVVMCCAAYATAGGVVTLLVCICGLIEILARRARLTGVLILLLGIAIPWLGGTYVYHIGREDAFLRLTVIEYDFSPRLAAIALYAFFPICLIGLSIWTSRPRRAGRPKKRRPQRAAGDTTQQASTSIASISLWTWGTAPTLLLAGLATYASFDADRRAVLAVDYHARHRQWQSALEEAQRLQWAGAIPGRDEDESLARTCLAFHFPIPVHSAAPLLPTYNVAIHDINLALAQRGRLLDEMFRYPQRMGASVVRLLPDDMGAYVTHSYNPDILLELGDVNEAERVTCECLANVGPRPWLLERLIAVSVLKGHAEAARTCLAVMAGDPWHRSRTETLRRDLAADPSLARWEQVRLARSRMYRTDRTSHIPNMDPDEEMLRYLLVANPHNRLAFDYLMAHYLLTLRADQVAASMRHLGEFGYTEIPRHCEEAILLRARLDGKTPNLAGLRIRPETVRRFEDFGQALDRLGGTDAPDRTHVRDALVAAYGDTYWFYALFGDSFWHSGPAVASRPAEGP